MIHAEGCLNSETRINQQCNMCSSAGRYVSESTVEFAEADTPLDSQQFTWSNDSYSSLQRSVEIWSFVIGLRSRLWLLDQKWSYLGYSDEQRSKRLRSLAAWSRYFHSDCVRAMKPALRYGVSHPAEKAVASVGWVLTPD